MKKAIITLLSLSSLLASLVYADDSGIAKLKMEISSNSQSAYDFCLDNTCYPIARTGQDIPIESGKIGSIILTSMHSGMMYSQALPTSCRTDIAKDEVIVVSGELVSKGDAATLSHLHCSINRVSHTI